MPRYQVLAVSDISKPQAGQGDFTKNNGRLIDVDEDEGEAEVTVDDGKKKNSSFYLKSSGKRCLKFMLSPLTNPQNIIPAFEFEELPIPFSTFINKKSVFLEIDGAENVSGFLLLTPRNAKLFNEFNTSIPPPRLSEIQVDDDFFISEDNIITLD